jgi:protease IV
LRLASIEVASFDAARPMNRMGVRSTSDSGETGMRRASFHYRCSVGGSILSIVAMLTVVGGCHHAIPVIGQFQGGAQVDARADVRGEVAVKLPSAVDPGPMVATTVEESPSGDASYRVALIDVDGLILNQNVEGIYDSGENPVAGFREKLGAAAADPKVVAVVLRIHSPGGGVTACDILADELTRFKAATHKPVVACLMDLAASGAYYLAVGADRIVAHPTTLTGGVGAIFNHVNLEDAMAQLNVRVEPVKSGPLIDMGTVTKPLDPQSREILVEMADGFRQRFLGRIAQQRSVVSDADLKAISDGRIIAAPKALSLHLVDQIGYLPDALGEARRLAGTPGAEVILYHRDGAPARSLYAIAPKPPRISEALPFSYPGLDRAKLPTFLYLWQPDPTLPRTTSR